MGLPAGQTRQGLISLVIRLGHSFVRDPSLYAETRCGAPVYKSRHGSRRSSWARRRQFEIILRRVESNDALAFGRRLAGGL